MSYYPPISVKQAIEKIDFNQYLLPAIQREFVWRMEQIEMLFDSLMRNYPIGSLLMWKVQGENKHRHKYYSILKNYREKYNVYCDEMNTNNLHEFEAILDGQQRLTALYIGLKGTYAVKKKNYAWRDNESSLPTKKLFLCLNKESIEEEDFEDGRLYNFKFLSEEEVKNSSRRWFEVGEILKITGTFELSQFLKKKEWDSDEYISNTISKLFDVIHVKTLINYYLELEQDYDKALNIFIRVNSGGEKLSYSDLIMSTIISGWTEINISARDEFKNLINEVWNSREIVIDKDLIIRAYLLIFSEDIKFRVSNFSLSNAKEFQENWIGIRKSIVEAIELIGDFGYTEKTLTSKNAILPLIYYLYVNNKYNDFRTKIAYKEDRAIIKRWFHIVLLKQIFGNQADSILKIIRDIIKIESMKNTKFPANEIAKKLSKTRKSISVDDLFLEDLLYTSYEDRYAFPILALLYPNLDYKNGDFNKDHIFPKVLFNSNKLKELNIDTSQERGHYYTEKSIFNGIVNLQMLDSNENKSKGKKMPEIWIEENNLDLDKYLLPNSLKFEDFITFVDDRWELLKIKLKNELQF